MTNHWIQGSSGQGVILSVHRQLVLGLRIRIILPAFPPFACVKYKGTTYILYNQKNKSGIEIMMMRI
jgi:hypothetical protein